MQVRNIESLVIRCWKKCLTQTDNRIRRIKCDKTKPHCKECTSAGRKCEGYVTEKRQLKNPKTVESKQEDQVPGPLTLCNPSLDICGSTGERRSFHYFRSRKMSDMPGNFEPFFWDHIILQFSHSYPTVQQSLFALSAIYEENDRDNQNPVKTTAALTKDPHALNQYNKAVRHLAEDLSKQQDLRVTLILCLIFFWVEILQNNLDSAFKHLDGGLKNTSRRAGIPLCTFLCRNTRDS
jgi:hypothetical protein